MFGFLSDQEHRSRDFNDKLLRALSLAVAQKIACFGSKTDPSSPDANVRFVPIPKVAQFIASLPSKR